MPFRLAKPAAKFGAGFQIQMTHYIL